MSNPNEDYLREQLAKPEREVTDDLIRQERRRVQREINDVMRKGNKARLFSRKNKRRKKR